VKPEFLKRLCCPVCQGELALHVFAEHGGEPEEGLLVCRGCARPYPLTNGVPRMLPNSFGNAFRERFSAQLAALTFRRPEGAEVGRFEKRHRLTARAFGYEWNTYRTTPREEDVLTYFWLTGLDPDLYAKIPTQDVFSYYPTAEEIAQIDPSALAGASVLDVGCGMGKYVKVVSEHAREVVGLDLSEAVDRARAETRERANVHLVQGDILAPPFREQTFDVVYSVGVLHHTPDCHRAFLGAARLVRTGGALAVWLYPQDPTPGPYAKRVHWIQDEVIRPITCRMPPTLLRPLCSVLGRLTFVRDRYAEKYRATGSRWAYRIAMCAGALAVGRHRDPEIAAFLNFDWYSPQYRSYHTEEELQRWFDEAGFSSVQSLPQRVSGIARRAVAPASADAGRPAGVPAGAVT
jgi:SAM-dependent methyltransferase/uncharacterized protein YbaR (Trm112 family)